MDGTDVKICTDWNQYNYISLQKANDINQIQQLWSVKMILYQGQMDSPCYNNITVIPSDIVLWSRNMHMVTHWGLVIIYWSPLIKIVACHMFGNKFQWNNYHNAKYMIEANAFQNDLCKMEPNLSCLQCAKYIILTT